MPKICFEDPFIIVKHFRQKIEKLSHPRIPRPHKDYPPLLFKTRHMEQKQKSKQCFQNNQQKSEKIIQDKKYLVSPSQNYCEELIQIEQVIQQHGSMYADEQLVKKDGQIDIQHVFNFNSTQLNDNFILDNRES